MKQYQYLLFDADNTLFDFTQAEYLSFRDTCSACNVRYSDELYQQYSVINDRLWKLLELRQIRLDELKIERFRQLLVAVGYADNETTLEQACSMRDSYIEHLSRQTCLIDGAEEICKKLSEQYTLYIVTNGISKIQRSRFGKSVLKPYFRDLFISEEIGVGKPAVEYYDHVLRTIGCNDKNSYLAIGDSLSSDCAGAIRYGIDICHYNPSGTSDNSNLPLTYTIKHLSELEAILL